MGTFPKGMHLCFNQKLPHAPSKFFTHWQSVPIKLGGLWCLWNQIMPHKDRNSDGVFMMIPSVSCCTASDWESLNLGANICDSIRWFNISEWGKEYTNHGRLWKSYDWLDGSNLRSGEFGLWQETVQSPSVTLLYVYIQCIALVYCIWLEDKTKKKQGLEARWFVICHF